MPISIANASKTDNQHWFKLQANCLLKSNIILYALELQSFQECITRDANNLLLSAMSW